MAKYRQNRINDSVKEEIAQILRDVKDPRVSGAFISITGADVTKDLKFAKIYFSVLGADRAEVTAAMTGAAGFFRKELARRLNLRITPALTFVYDESIEYGATISAILKDLNVQPEQPEQPEQNDTEAPEDVS